MHTAEKYSMVVDTNNIGYPFAAHALNGRAQTAALGAVMGVSETPWVSVFGGFSCSRNDLEGPRGVVLSRCVFGRQIFFVFLVFIVSLGFVYLHTFIRGTGACGCLCVIEGISLLH